MADTKRPATAGDMIRSMAVILVPVMAIMALLTYTPDKPEVRTVPWATIAQDARAQAPWPVLAPNGLPEGPEQWRATRAHWSKPGEAGPIGKQPSPRHHWFLGMISPDEIHYALHQADGDQDSFVAEAVPGATPAGEVTIGGQRWTQLQAPNGRTRALVRRAPTDVVVVAADTDFGHLDQFARTLSQG